MNSPSAEPERIKNQASQGRAIGCGFWILWMLATVLGTSAGWLAGWWVSFRAPAGISTLILGLLVGFFIGFFQWLVLRPHLPGAGWWVLASSLGWGVGFFSGAALAYAFDLVDIGFGLAIGAGVGVSAGVLQSLFLRRHSRRAVWWLPASIFSWTFAFLFYRAGLSAIGAYYGLLVGMVTGWALIGILGLPAEE